MKKNYLYAWVMGIVLLSCNKQHITPAEDTCYGIPCKTANEILAVANGFNVNTGTHTEAFVQRIYQKFGTAMAYKTHILHFRHNRKVIAEKTRQQITTQQQAASNGTAVEVVGVPSGNYQVRLVNSNEGLDVTIAVRPNQFILDAAEENGVNLAYSDRSGASTASMSRVYGATNTMVDQTNGSFLNDCDIAAGFVSYDIAMPKTNFTLYTGKEEEFYNGYAQRLIQCGYGPLGGNGGNMPPPYDFYHPVTPCQYVDSLTALPSFDTDLGVLQFAADNDSVKKEHGFYYSHNNNNRGNLFSTHFEGEANKAEINFSLPYPIDGFMHSHYVGLLPVFSGADLLSIVQIYNHGNMRSFATFTATVVTASNTQYMLRIDDTTKFKTYALANEDTPLDPFDDALDKFGVNTKNTLALNEKNFLHFVRANNIGLSVFKRNVNTTKWNRIKVNDNDQVVNNPCN